MDDRNQSENAPSEPSLNPLKRGQELNQKPTPKKKFSSKKIWLMATLVTIALIAATVASLMLSNQSPPYSPIQPSPIPTEADPLIPTNVPAKSTNHYYLKISSNSTEDVLQGGKYISLVEYLENILSTKIKRIVYDERESTPGWLPLVIYNSNFYIVTTDEIKVSNAFSDEHVLVEINPVNTDLEPYLDSEEYCNTDSDCTITYMFCTTGAYNHFHQYAIYGCLPGEDDEAMPTPIEYQGVACVQNQCVALE